MHSNLNQQQGKGFTCRQLDGESIPPKSSVASAFNLSIQMSSVKSEIKHLLLSLIETKDATSCEPFG